MVVVVALVAIAKEVIVVVVDSGTWIQNLITAMFAGLGVQRSSFPHQSTQARVG